MRFEIAEILRQPNRLSKIFFLSALKAVELNTINVLSIYSKADLGVAPSEIHFIVEDISKYEGVDNLVLAQLHPTEYSATVRAEIF